MRHVPSPNHGPRRDGVRPDIIVLHYTEMASAEAAVRWLCDPASGVSAHYCIAADGRLIAMVEETRRAWHAGVSSWDGTRDVNSRSIGIELDSPGHAPGPPVFPAGQIASLVALIAGIRERWPVPRRNVVAHSDVAPLRKRDPGECFPWRTLAVAGHALFVLPQPGRTEEGPPGIPALRASLAACGYDIAPTGPVDDALDAVVTAFHRRFIPENVGHPADATTAATADAVAAEVEADRARETG